MTALGAPLEDTLNQEIDVVAQNLSHALEYRSCRYLERAVAALRDSIPEGYRRADREASFTRAFADIFAAKYRHLGQYIYPRAHPRKDPTEVGFYIKGLLGKVLVNNINTLRRQTSLRVETHESGVLVLAPL